MKTGEARWIPAPWMMIVLNLLNCSTFLKQEALATSLLFGIRFVTMQYWHSFTICQNSSEVIGSKVELFCHIFLYCLTIFRLWMSRWQTTTKVPRRAQPVTWG